MIIKNGSNCIVTPPNELVIKSVASFVAELKENLVDCKSILLNLDGIIEMDSAGFESLIALKTEALSRDIRLELSDLSCVVEEMLTLYDVVAFMKS